MGIPVISLSSTCVLSVPSNTKVGKVIGLTKSNYGIFAIIKSGYFHFGNNHYFHFGNYRLHPLKQRDTVLFTYAFELLAF